MVDEIAGHRVASSSSRARGPRRSLRFIQGRHREARPLTLSYAKALGVMRTGRIETTFRKNGNDLLRRSRRGPVREASAAW